MRLLWLSHFLPYPPKGGAPQRSYHLLRHAALRHEVDVVTLYRTESLPTEGQYEQAIEHLSGMVQSLRTYPIATDGSRWRWLALVARTGLHTVPYDVNWLRNQAMVQRIRALADEHFDLVHVDTVGLWPYAELLPTVPKALHHHNIESHLMARRAELEPRRFHRHYFQAEARKLQRFERRVCPAADVNLVVSDLDGNRLRQVAPEARVAVVNNGVDVEYFRPDPETASTPGSLVFAGSMNWYPNRAAVLYFLNDIWPALIAADPDRSATFIGQDPPAALTNHPDARLRATGFVDDLRPLLDASEVYVCPIRDGGGTRLKILDALAMAKPLVATGMAVEGLALVSGTHYLRAETPQEFVAQVDLLRRTPELRHRLAAAARRLVEERYSWSVVGKELEAGYAAAVGGTTRPSRVDGDMRKAPNQSDGH
jgi:glycosyltransferase involved in cell wall biosynthesis